MGVLTIRVSSVCLLNYLTDLDEIRYGKYTQNLCQYQFGQS
jgi:hypothetical protein